MELISKIEEVDPGYTTSAPRKYRLVISGEGTFEECQKAVSVMFTGKIVNEKVKRWPKQSPSLSSASPLAQ